MEQKPLLPIVDPDIGVSINAELQTSEYFSATLQRIRLENPYVANFISLFAAQSKDPTSTAGCAILVYRLLESQAEVNRMEGKGG